MADWSNHENYTLADEAEALKAHLNKATSEKLNLRLKLSLSQAENESLKETLAIWLSLAKSGDLYTNPHNFKTLMLITELSLVPLGGKS